MSARDAVWHSLDATTDEAVRTIAAGEGAHVDELTGGLEIIALAAEGAGMADVTSAVRQRVAALTKRRGLRRGPRALPPVSDERLPELANALLVFTDVASEMGQNAYAEWACRLAGDLYTRLEGPRSRSFVVMLSSLSVVYSRAGLYEEADTSGSLAWDLAQEIGGLEPADEAMLLVNLGAARSRVGRFNESAGFYQRACALLAPLDGYAEEYALALNNLGAIEVKRGRVGDAQTLLREALELRRHVLGDNDPAVAETLMNLALLALDLNRWGAAESLYEEALKIRQATWPGIDHPMTAQAMSSLAITLHQAGEVEAALRLGEDALAMRRRLFAEVAHNDLAESLNNVAHMHAVAGRLDEAERLWKESVATAQAASGYDFPELAKTFGNLAQLYAARGNLQQARPAAQAAVRIASRALGEDHPEVATHLGTLAIVQAMGGDRAGALDNLRRAGKIEDAAFWRVTRMSSARGRMLYSAGTGGVVDAFLSVMFSGAGALSRQENAEVADIVLRRKGLEFETLAVQREVLRRNSDTELTNLASALAEARRELVRLELTGPRGDPEGHEQALLDAGIAREQLEADLAERIPELDLGPALQSVSAERVRSLLPAGSALIDIFRIEEPDLRPGAGRFPIGLKGAWYVAVVAHAARDAPSALVLGDAAAIDEMVDSFRTAIMTGASEIGVGGALRSELIEPLMPLVGGAAQIYLAPDGDLFELPFDALPLEDGRRLIDIWEITYLTTGRELLRPPAQAIGDPGPPLVVGDPDFDLGDIGTSGSPPAFECSALSFERLQYTRREAERVASALGVEPLVDVDALEGVVKSSHSPRVVHMATHGFFLPREPEPRGVPDGGALVRPLPPNPLLRSGLLLAGARTWCRGGVCPADAEDGLLTAEDASMLDLLDTELVVLSACESGLGVIQTGEGVHGLRRAFELAGAHAVMMSLWKVGDEVTERLMGRFYDALQGGVEPAAALREAQAGLRTEQPDYPFAWAAFLCQGVPRETRRRAQVSP